MEIVGFTMNPDDTQKRHGIRSYAIRRQRWTFGHGSGPGEATAKDKLKRIARKNRVVFGLFHMINGAVIRAPRAFFQEVVFLLRSFQVVKSLDQLVINGGGQLTEWGGPWGFPYTIFKWILLARLARVRRVFLNVGAGPLTQPLSKFFVKHALRLADDVSFRDEESRTLVRKIGFGGSCRVFPDSAYSLGSPMPNTSDGFRRSDRRRIGIAPMPYCDPRAFPKKDQAVYDEFIRKLGLFGARLAESGYGVALFGTATGADPLTIHDLESILRNESGIVDGSSSIMNESVGTLDELLARISLMECVVTCRFHGIVFAHMLNKPVLALSHHPKMTTLMNDIGLGKYCIDIRTFDLETLWKTFAALVRDADEIKERMAQKLACYREALSTQMDELFPRSTA